MLHDQLLTALHATTALEVTALLLPCMLSSRPSPLRRLMHMLFACLACTTLAGGTATHPPLNGICQHGKLSAQISVQQKQVAAFPAVQSAACSSLAIFSNCRLM